MNYSLEHARSTSSSRATCCPGHIFMLPAETFQTRKCLLIISPEKPRENTEALLKTYEMLICGDFLLDYQFIFKNMLKKATLLPVL
jgi:hypothetical protein